MKANPKVFISYSRKDKDFAIQLDASLLAVGVQTFLDSRDIRVAPDSSTPGLSWHATHASDVRELHRSFIRGAGELRGALDAMQASSTDKMSVMALKYLFEEDRFPQKVRAAFSRCFDVIPEDSSRIQALRRSMLDVLELLEVDLSGAGHRRRYSEVIGVADTLVTKMLRTADMLDELRQESEIVLMASVRRKPD